MVGESGREHLLQAMMSVGGEAEFFLSVECRPLCTAVSPGRAGSGAELRMPDETS
jgi:hypothetical protein